MAARIRKVTLNDDWRAKIRVTTIMNRLQAHVDGEVELSTTQISAAKIILGKLVPDLSATKNDTNITGEIALREIRNTIVDPHAG
jgi:hypothetical protein